MKKAYIEQYWITMTDKVLKNGIRLLEKGKHDRALELFQQVLQQQPQSVEALRGAAVCYAKQGKWLEALNAILNGMGFGDYKAAEMEVFVQILQASRLTSYIPPIEIALKKVMNSRWFEYAATALLTIQFKAKYKTELERCDTVGNDELLPMLQDDTLCLLIERACVTDHQLEKTILRARALLLQQAAAGQNIDKYLPFLAAFVCQRLLNDGLYDINTQEQQWLESLTKIDLVSVTLKLCYAEYEQAIDIFQSHKALFKASTTKAMVNDLTLYAEIAKNKQSGGVADETSQLVQSFYMENPYPKYKCPILSQQPLGEMFVQLGKKKPILPKILIAGCGTGRQVIQLAMINPTAQLLAIDLSPVSLTYAEQMATTFGLTNVEFALLDILDVAKLERKFDHIVCTGVLHHMANPLLGLQCLAAVLKPSGIMLLGFYSQLARQDLSHIKTKILQQTGLQAPQMTRAALRSWRANLSTEEIRQIWFQMSDFFSLSGLMDLLFHPQQTEYDLLQIEQMLDTAGLNFMQMMLSNFSRSVYGEKVNQLLANNAKPSLTQWHELEQQCPYSFIDMYNLYVDHIPT